MKRTKCTAKSKTSGKRCAQFAIPGGTVCRFHGGAAPQVQKSAKERLAAAALIMIGGMEAKDAVDIAKHGIGDDKVRYLIYKDTLDRSGLKPVIEVEHSGLVEHIVTRLQAARKRTSTDQSTAPAGD